jgi:hypothetical protein
MLTWLNVHPVAELRAAVSEDGPELAAMRLLGQHHNQVGIAAGWLTKYMAAESRHQVSSEADRVAMFNAAGAYWTLRNALVEVRVGVRGFEASGRLIRLPYQGNHAIDALDRLLDRVESLESVTRAPAFSASVAVRDWIHERGRSQPWSACPPFVTDAFRSHARKLVATYLHYLPDDTVIAGVTRRDVSRFWEELLAWGMQMYMATMAGSKHVPTVLPLLPRQALIDSLAESTELSPSVVSIIVDLLTLDLSRCKDGALTPLVPIDELIAPMSTLIVPTSPQRNFLAILQSDPSRVGETGRLLGEAGEHAVLKVLDRLRPGALVRKRIKVLRADGKPAGDFDVVACDPETRTGVILEIRWGIAADGNAEVYRSEQAAIDKRAQVVRLRDEVNQGTAQPKWPADWPDMRGYNFRWYVLTWDVLAMKSIADDDVTIRSCQLMSRTLHSGATIADLITVLDSPPVPPEGLTQTHWGRFHYGDLRVEMESVIT